MTILNNHKQISKRQLEISKLNSLLSVLLPYKQKHDEHALRMLRGKLPSDTKPLYHNEDGAYNYFNACVIGLLLEAKHPSKFKECNKELLIHFDTPKIDVVQEVMEYYFKIYDTLHPIRFAIETMDSIE